MSPSTVSWLARSRGRSCPIVRSSRVGGWGVWARAGAASAMASDAPSTAPTVPRSLGRKQVANATTLQPPQTPAGAGSGPRSGRLSPQRAAVAAKLSAFGDQCGFGQELQLRGAAVLDEL